MVFTEFFSWWYGPGWARAYYKIFSRVRRFSEEMSLPILANTLFEPWKQISNYAAPSSNLDAKFMVWFDNLFSRFFGFFIRLGVIIFSFIAGIIIFAAGLAIALVWPLIPAFPIFLFIMFINA